MFLRTGPGGAEGNREADILLNQADQINVTGVPLLIIRIMEIRFCRRNQAAIDVLLILFSSVPLTG